MARNEANFLEQLNIERIEMPLSELVTGFQKTLLVHGLNATTPFVAFTTRKSAL